MRRAAPDRGRGSWDGRKRCPRAIAARGRRRPASSGSHPHSAGRSTQMVLVVTPAWDSTSGTLRRFERATPTGAWRQVGDVEPIVVGRTGRGVGRPARSRCVGRAGEARGRRPLTGWCVRARHRVRIRQSRGHSWVRLPYVRLRATTECVDDARSAHYNTIVDRDSVQRVDWTSSEKMREIDQYAYGVHVAYNAPPTPLRGSCIFLHVWAGPRSVTAGCTAMTVDALKELIGVDRSAAAADARAASAERELRPGPQAVRSRESGQPAGMTLIRCDRAIGVASRRGRPRVGPLDCQVRRVGDEEDADRACDGECGAGGSERSLLRIDGERVDVVGELIRGEQPAAGRIDGEAARCLASRRRVTERGETSVPRVDGEGSDAVVAAIGSVHEASGRMHDDFGGGVRDGGAGAASRWTALHERRRSRGSTRRRRCCSSAR